MPTLVQLATDCCTANMGVAFKHCDLEPSLGQISRISQTVVPCTNDDGVVFIHTCLRQITAGLTNEAPQK